MVGNFTDKLAKAQAKAELRKANAKRVFAENLGKAARAYDSPLFSTFRFAIGAGGTIASGSYTVFNQMQGQSGQGFAAPLVLTEVDTNLTVAGMLPVGKLFTAERFGIAIQDDAGTTGLSERQMQSILNNIAVAYTYNNDTFEIGRVVDWPAGQGASGFSAVDGAAALVENRILTNGIPAPSAMRRLSKPIEIKDSKQFRGIFRVPRDIVNLTNEQDIRLVWIWFGVMRDAVQPR